MIHQRLTFLFVLALVNADTQCQLVSRPWAPQPIVCIGCNPGRIDANGTTSQSSQSNATFHSCIPCKVVLEGCVLCGVVEPSNISQSNSRLRCVDSQTSSTRGEWPEPEDGYRKPPPPPIIISNDGYHPGSIKFQKIKYDETNFEWKRASVCGSLKFAGFSSLDSLLSFECVCDRTCVLKVS